MEESSLLWQETLCREQKAPCCTFVIFGASGDLAMRKLFPALFALHKSGLLHENTKIIGCARHPFTTGTFREKIASGLSTEGAQAENQIRSFLEHISYTVLDYSTQEDFKNLAAGIPEQGLVIFYLALPSMIYPQTIRHLSESGLLREDPAGTRKCQAVFEKPFGLDLASFRRLDRELKKYITEQQIYRIDHYLGKETVQNIFLLRFANRIFEPVWNRDHIDSIQITVSEMLGVENRAGYFDRAGILRDMFQNHLLEVLSLVTMECPEEFSADSVRKEKLKLIRSIRSPGPEDAVRAQYESYTREKGIAPDSRTETFAAMRLWIDSPRWKGVPVYLRAGKKLACRKTQIHILFKSVPRSIFPGIRKEDLCRNVLSLSIQPQEGLALTLQAKKPGPKLCMGKLTLRYGHTGEKAGVLDAYARLLLDCQLSDQTLFIKSDIIESSWKLFRNLLQQWEKDRETPMLLYRDGSAGPEKSFSIPEKDARQWMDGLC